MGIVPNWLANEGGQRVVTPDGLGTIKVVKWPLVEVALDQPVAGKDDISYSVGQISLDTDFLVARVMMVDGVGLVTSGYNCPDWDSALMHIHNMPYIEDETLQAFNFTNQHFTANRPLGKNYGYMILTGYLDRHICTECIHFDSLEPITEIWERKIERLSGTSCGIYFAVWVDLENVKILGRALFSTVNVIKMERF